MGMRSRLYGLTVESPRALSRPADPDSPVDVVIEFDDEPADQSDPIDGTTVLLDPAESRRYELVRRADGSLRYRLNGLADVEIDEDWSHLSCRMVPGADPRLLDVVLAGLVMATRMSIAGDVVLHSSGIEVDGSVVGLVGRSGGGKSTLAAMSCLAGARLVTDDVLRLRPRDGAFWCPTGVGHLRLRPTSKVLAENEDVAHDMSGDGRHLFAPDLAADREHRVDRLVMIRLVSEDGRLLRQRIPDAAALMAMMHQQRVLGWRDPDLNARHFAGLGELIDRVPVYAIDVPWGVEAGGIGEPLLELLTTPDDEAS